MNGCIYRTKYGECTIPNRSMEYGPICRSDCTEKHPSNADLIRAMGEEELADYAYKILGNYCCPPEREFDANNCIGLECSKCWLDWLKQEAKQ